MTVGDAREDVLDAVGPAAPPRANGELVFTAPWQSRLFGTTMRLFEAELFEWDRFRHLLIANINRHTGQLVDDDDYDYWGCWQQALEHLVGELGLVSSDELATTAAAFATRPAGHDHHHTHDHDHDHDRDHPHEPSH